MENYLAVLMEAFDVVPLVIEVWDKNLKCINFNQAAAEHYGINSKEEYNRKVSEFGVDFQPEGTESCLFWNNMLTKAFNEGYAKFEYMTKTKDGKAAFCEIVAKRMEYNNECVVVTYANDTTASKELLEEKERLAAIEQNSEAKTRFLARMSHEIRTPITAVLGASEIQLHNSNLPIHVEEAFAKIYNSAGVLLSIVNDILDLSKIEAGKMSIIEQKYEVANLVIDVMQLQLVYLGSKKIDFLVNVDEKLPAVLVGDELRIKQILNNLLSNAFKYTNAGVIELALNRQECPIDSYISLEICIRDTGYGMSQKQLDTIAGEYTRFHEQEAGYIEGTGLGMPIVYNLVQLMGATIDIQSEVGKGTSIVVRIPQHIGGKELIGANKITGFWDAEAFKRLVGKEVKFAPEPMPYGKVLVVDDVEANLYVAKGLLQFFQLQVETCSSGYEAIEKIKSGQVYDIVFMDHMMPDLNGIETTKTLRTLGYNHPVVALTANALIGQAEEFLKNGFDGFVSKPIQVRRLNDVLNKFVRDKQPPYVIEAALASSSAPKTIAQDYLYSTKISDKLQADFAKSQKNAISDLRQALKEHDLKTAHRLAHSLKGLAGLIHEHNLANAASIVENQLKQEEVSQPHLDALETELKRVLGHIASLQSAQFVHVPKRPSAISKANAEQARKLIKQLEPLLEQRSADSLNLLHELSLLPGTEKLCEQIEDFDLKLAYETFSEWKNTLDESISR